MSARVLRYRVRRVVNVPGEHVEDMWTARTEWLRLDDPRDLGSGQHWRHLATDGTVFEFSVDDWKEVYGAVEAKARELGGTPVLVQSDVADPRPAALKMPEPSAPAPVKRLIDYPSKAHREVKPEEVFAELLKRGLA